MTDTNLISTQPKDKSFAENSEADSDNSYLESNQRRVQNSEQDQSSHEIYMDDDKLCPQCGQDHRYKTTAGSAIQEMISFLDRDMSDAI